MLKCECYESRKKYTYGAWLNPKQYYSGQSAGKLRTEETSTTIPYGSRAI